MYLHALATAVPSRCFTQAQCWDIVENSDIKNRLKGRSLFLLKRILLNDTNVATRHFAVPEVERAFDLTHDQLNEAFRTEAPKLAATALTRALDQAGLRANDLDALLICTCTGYLCPGLTSYVSELLGLKPDMILQDLVGLGCGAAIPTLRSASHVLAAHPGATVACIAIEVCSAAFYLDDDLGVLISACLFGDGAAASIWKSTPGPTGLRASDFQSFLIPEDRDFLRFETRDGKLRNRLDRSVPQRAAAAVKKLWGQKSDRPVAQVIAHPGGRDVLEALSVALPGYSLDHSARVLRSHGNMSSPSVLFALDDFLAHSGPPDADGDLWLTSFGAGFSAHACRLGVSAH